MGGDFEDVEVQLWMGFSRTEKLGSMVGSRFSDGGEVVDRATCCYSLIVLTDAD
jgi:hypothetical protein